MIYLYPTRANPAPSKVLNYDNIDIERKHPKDSEVVEIYLSIDGELDASDK